MKWLDGEGKLRAHYAKFQKLFQGLTPAEFEAKRQAMDMAFLRQGVTFNVYGDAQGRGTDFSVRHDSAHHPGEGMGAYRARSRTAHHGAESFSP